MDPPKTRTELKKLRQNVSIYSSKHARLKEEMLSKELVKETAKGIKLKK